MAITKRVIVLEQTNASPLMFRVVMWADTPAARQPFYAALQAGMTSAWKDAAPADNAALQNGSVTERVDVATIPLGSNLAQAQAILAANWVTWNAAVQASNPWQRYGTSMDTANSWTNGGAA